MVVHPFVKVSREKFHCCLSSRIHLHCIPLSWSVFSICPNCLLFSCKSISSVCDPGWCEWRTAAHHPLCNVWSHGPAFVHQTAFWGIKPHVWFEKEKAMYWLDSLPCNSFIIHTLALSLKLRLMIWFKFMHLTYWADPHCATTWNMCSKTVLRQLLFPRSLVLLRVRGHLIRGEKTSKTTQTNSPSSESNSWCGHIQYTTVLPKCAKKMVPVPLKLT